MLLAASRVFYMWFVPKYILILLVTIIIDYAAGILMEKHENDPKAISDMVWAYFPNARCGDMTKDASHAEIYYNMLKLIPKESSVETVVVTMNLRSFDAGWIYSRLETALQKQLVLLKNYPPLVNRFLLAFKAYPIRSEAEWD